MHIYRAAIIVKKKKKEKVVRGFQLRKEGGFTWKGGSIRVMDRRMDRDCIDREQEKEERRVEGKGKGFSEKNERRTNVEEFIDVYARTYEISNHHNTHTINFTVFYSTPYPPEYVRILILEKSRIRPISGHLKSSLRSGEEFIVSLPSKNSPSRKDISRSLVLSRKRFRSIRA